jgi:hypothetical protein
MENKYRFTLETNLIKYDLVSELEIEIMKFLDTDKTLFLTISYVTRKKWDLPSLFNIKIEFNKDEILNHILSIMKVAELKDE